MSSQLKIKEDKKLLKSLNLENDDEVVLGEVFKSEYIRLIMVKSKDLNEYNSSGRALCIRCKCILSAKDGGHINRHVTNCLQKRAMSEPLPDEEITRADDSEEPLKKQRKLTEFSRKRFTKEQIDKIAGSMSKHALLTGKSFNYIASNAMKELLIDVANAAGNGFYGKEALDQIPCRQTIQKKVLSMSEKLLKTTFDSMRPFVGKRVNFVCDHGKLVSNYLSLFASFLDEKFQLKLLPIGFVPCPDGKTGSETAKVIIERCGEYGWTEEQVKMCSVTADGALKTLADHFDRYVRCVSHSIHLVAHRVVKPLGNHRKLMDTNTLDCLENAVLALDNAQTVSSSIRNNLKVCAELSKLPTLPNDTRWLNGLKCLEDVYELADEIQKISPQLSARGKCAFNWLTDNAKIVNSLLLILKPLLPYNLLFQSQNQVTLHHVLPAYKLLETKWRRYEAKVFTEVKDKDRYDLDFVHALATSGLYSLKHYYAEFDDYHYGAVFLNPKTKKMTMFDEFERERATSFVSELLPLETQPATPKKSNIPDYIREMSDSCEEIPKHDDFQRYMEEYVDSESEETIEQYWYRKRYDFPCLYEVAGRIFSVIPSESVCETSFSTAGFLLDKRRSRLQYCNAEKVVVGCQIASRFPEWIKEF